MLIGRGGLTDHSGVHLDGNELFRDAIHAFRDGVSAWIPFALIALVMSPWIIPTISKAILEHRALSHRREVRLLMLKRDSKLEPARSRLEPDGP